MKITVIGTGYVELVEAIKANLKQPVIFDYRNLYDPALPRKAGLEYFTIARKI